MLNLGTEAPAFELPDQTGKVRTSGELQGSWAVLYFYPKDDTPGCTAEACAFSSALPAFDALDAVIFGISADDVASHKAFAEKHDIRFPLLADVDRTAIDAYHAWGRKEREGVAYEGILRISYLIDPQGRVAAAWNVTDPESHPHDVAEELRRQRG